MKNKSKQATSQQHIKTTMQNTNMIDLFNTNQFSLNVDVIPPGAFHSEDEIPPGKRSAFILPVDVLQKTIRDDEEVYRMLGLFLKTPEGKNLQYQFDSGLVDQDEYRLRRKELFGSFIKDLNTKAGF